jgi:hypothetical protein
MSCNNNIKQLNNCNDKLTNCQNNTSLLQSQNKTDIITISNLTKNNNNLKNENNLLQDKLENLMLKCNLNGNSLVETTGVSKYGTIPNNSYLQFKTIANTELFSNIEPFDINKEPIVTYLDINNQNNIIRKSQTTLNDKYSTTTYNQTTQYIINETNNLKQTNNFLFYIYFFIVIVIIFLFIFIDKPDNKQKIIYIILFLIFPFVIYLIEYYIYFGFVYIYSIISGNAFNAGNNRFPF